jgi:hypothetical protein
MYSVNRMAKVVLGAFMLTVSYIGLRMIEAVGSELMLKEVG